MEESQSSEVSCQFSASSNGQVEVEGGGVNLQALMRGFGRGFEDMFAPLDMGCPVLHSGMQVHMQTNQNQHSTTSRSTVVRQGRKITMATTSGFGDFNWSDDSD